MKKQSAEKLKAVVRKKYGEIAGQKAPSSCCGGGPSKGKGPSCCECGPPDGEPYSFMGEDYGKISGYVAEADLGLGCGVPTELAEIRQGDTVVDLGSGAGNDAFIARRIVGESGRVIGVDMTAEMIKRARGNNRKLGYENVEFLLGEIEHLPVEDETADVIISNCVLNLVPDKAKAFQEMFRIMKPGARFCVSDIVVRKALSEEVLKAAELYAGCVAGAIPKKEYLGLLRAAGFREVKTAKERSVDVPGEVLRQYLGKEELLAWKKEGSPLLSVTVTGVKP
jgi:arsenite methyltransferase